jgi:ceramide glucosyltransferase
VSAVPAVALSLLALSVADRWAKVWIATRFAARGARAGGRAYARAESSATRWPDRPDAEGAWPSVSLVQPITAGATDLAENLRARLALDYPGALEHLLVVDGGARGAETRAVCEEIIARAPAATATIVEAVPSEVGRLHASKADKMAAGVARARGDVVCFMDDDIAPTPTLLRHFVAALANPVGGAAFGLPRSTRGTTRAERIVSAFCNGNAWTSYVVLGLAMTPPSVTGHTYALRREVLDEIGVPEDVNEDHVVALRLRAIGLVPVQSAGLYDVANAFADWPPAAAQLRRWVVFTKFGIMPRLRRAQRTGVTLLTLGGFLPLGITALALAAPGTSTIGAAVAAVASHVLSHRVLWRRAFGRAQPWRWTGAAVADALLVPAYMGWLLLTAGRAYRWRGQTHRHAISVVARAAEIV